jgi:peptidyl-prolyl cis-trans isomerase, cyclophilin-binding
MKKITLLLGFLMLMIFSVGNAKMTKEERKFKKAMKKFEMEAVIKTTKGDISVYLYPEAAPKSVANFVFLAKNNFYNGLTFHRVIPNVLVQGGDPLGNGTGGTGYVIDDEISSWLNFQNGGMLAMANSGPNTSSSQFFITIIPLPHLDGKHTIIGETKTRQDLSVVRVIRPEDKILSIEIKGRKIDDFLNYFAYETTQWEAAMKAAQEQQ